MCEIILSYPNTDHFYMAFLIMEWSTISRVENYVYSHVNHFNWRYDILVTYFSHFKKNKECLDQSKPCHVHSNPNNQEIFPVNALEMYILLDPHKLIGG